MRTSSKYSSKMFQNCCLSKTPRYGLNHLEFRWSTISGYLRQPVAALKTVSCYEFARWAELLEGKESTTGLDYLAVSIFGGVTFAQDVEKVVINVPTLNSTSSIAALDIGEQSHVLRKIWKTLEVQQKVTNVSMGNSSQCRMWRLARLRNLVLLPRVASMCF